MKPSSPIRSAVYAVPLLASLICQTVRAQNSSLFYEDARGEGPPLTLPQASWVYIATPPPRRIDLHDSVVVRVEELARMTSDGEINRRKTSNYNAQLKDWLIWPSLLTVKPTRSPTAINEFKVSCSNRRAAQTNWKHANP